MTLAGHAALLFATVPIHIYILAVIFLREKATWWRTAGIILAGIGVYIVLSGGMQRFGREYLLGDFLVLIAVIAWAVATVMAKPIAIKYGTFRVIGLAMVYGSALYWPYGFYRTDLSSLGKISAEGWFSALYMAIVVSVLAYFLWYWVLKYMEATRVAVLQNLQPIIAAAIAAVMLAEPISRNFVIGGIIALAGIILTERR